MSTDTPPPVTDYRPQFRQYIDSSRGRLTTEELYRGVLTHFIQVSEAVAGIVFQAGAEGLDESGGVHFAELLQYSSAGPDVYRRLSEVAGACFQSGEPERVTPDAGDPLASLACGSLLLCPFRVGDEPYGVFLVAESAESYSHEQPDADVALRLLADVMVMLSEELTRRVDPFQADEKPLPPEFWSQLATFAVRLQSSLLVDQVATISAQGACEILQADAVSVCLRRGAKTMLLDSSSTLEKSNARADLVKLLTALCGTVIDEGQTVAFPSTTQTLSPKQETALGKFREKSGARLVLAIPLHQSGPFVTQEMLKPEPPHRKPEPDRKAFACLLVEYGRTRQPIGQVALAAEYLSGAIEKALGNAEKYQKVPARPVVFGIASAWDWLKGRGLLKVSTIVGSIALLAFLIGIIPVTYEVEAEGMLMPAEQRYVFAPFDGRVEEVLIEGSEEVNAGDPLIVIINDEMQTRILSIENQIAEQEASIRGAKARREAAVAEGDRLQVSERQAEIETGEKRLAGLKRELEELKSQDQRRTIKSPISGVVTTYQPRQLLENRAVSRGEILLEVMDDGGKWRLELQVDEQDMGHILEGQRVKREPLPIEFVLVTDPEEKHPAKLTRIASRSTEKQDGQLFVEVHAALDEKLLPDKRIGASVFADIQTGPSTLAYYYLGGFYDFLRRKFWM